MEPASIGAMRQYQIARQALSPDGVSKGTPAIEKPSAENTIAEGIKEFSEVFEQVETATEAMVAGTGDAHSVVEALANAEVALETAVTIRNRVVEAYQELLRMPV